MIAKFKESEDLAAHIGEHPNFTICDEVIGAMISDCIQPATENDCCCPYYPSIIHPLRCLKKAYQVKDLLSKNCDCDSCAEGSITRTALKNMSDFRAACCPCQRVLNGT